MRTFSRLRSIIFKAISVLVILLNLALMVLVWIVQDDVSSSAVAIFTEVDHVTQVMGSGIARVEPELLTLKGIIVQVGTASEEIAQNVSEEGIILRLLPHTVGERLTSSSLSLRDNFIAVYDLLEMTSEVLLALNNIPFVEIPEKGLSTIATLQGSMEEITGQVELLKNTISDTREEAGIVISKVTAASAILGAEVDQFQSDLIQIKTDLDAIQIKVRRYQRLTPPVVLTFVIILSLLSGWVVYSQINMISRPERINCEKNKGHLKTA